jgi:hypothetical protein
MVLSVAPRIMLYVFERAPFVAKNRSGYVRFATHRRRHEGDMRKPGLERMPAAQKASSNHWPLKSKSCFAPKHFFAQCLAGDRSRSRRWELGADSGVLVGTIVG